MDPLTSLSLASSALAIFQTSYKIYRTSLQLASLQQHQLLARNYGAFIASVVAWLSPETPRQYERIHNSILRGSKEEAMSFRQAITDECNMTAVAVSLAHIVSFHPLKCMEYAFDKGIRVQLSPKWQSRHSVCHFSATHIGSPVPAFSLQ